MGFDIISGALTNASALEKGRSKYRQFYDINLCFWHFLIHAKMQLVPSCINTSLFTISSHCSNFNTVDLN